VNGTDCSGGTAVCLGGSCVACTPNATPTQCASTCSKVPQYCNSSGAWTDATSCTGANSCSAGTCSLAPNEQVGQYTQLSTSINGLADILLANRIQITCRSDLLQLGARFQTAAGSVRFAIYTDNNNVPGSIVAGTSSVVVTAGITTASTSSVPLAAGYYWVVMNLSSQTAAPYYQEPVAAGTTHYQSYAFSTVSFPPTTFTNEGTLPHLYNLYAVVRRNP
jgi:hypothetical protein